MSLLEETYRTIDPDGIINMAYDDSESKSMAEHRNETSSKEKNGKSLLDA